jgi:anti-sigma regulatory factor (Ser/Thr protein kinase)
MTEPVSMLYTEPDDLAAVRAFARARALAFGLPRDRTELLVLAVSELATNTLQHTSGGGEIKLWVEPGRLFCEVFDSGRRRPFGEMPAAESERGRGLAIVSRVADDVLTSSGADGTAVRIRMDL